MGLRFTWMALGMLTIACGRIGPGEVDRPAASGSYVPSTGPNNSGATGSSSGYKSPFDEKGCTNQAGESAAAQQAACRRK